MKNSSLNLTMNLNCKKISLVIMLVSVFLLAFPPAADNASATHFTDEIKWQLVYLSSHPACSNYDYQMTEKYDEITDKYFELYQFENTKYDSLCLTEQKYLSEYEFPQDLDLLIMVLDRNLGEEELHSQKMGGMYTHSGTTKIQNHVIMFCDCANFYYSDPVWILTHELSHFVLYYLDYDFSVIEDFVHTFDEKYDQCRENYDETCESVVFKLRVDVVAYSYAVMPPYQPAIGMNIDRISIDDIPPSLLELNKVITKWWSSGKITEGEYANVLGLMIDGAEFFKLRDSQVLFKDDPIDNVEMTWEDVLLKKEEKTTSYLLAKIPNFLKSDEERIFMGEDTTGLPSWFKETAEWWAEGKTSNEEYVKSVEYLRNTGVIRSD